MEVDVGVGVDVGIGVEVSVGVGVDVDVGVDVGVLVKVGVGVEVPRIVGQTEDRQPKATAEMTTARVTAPIMKTEVLCELPSILSKVSTPVG